MNALPRETQNYVPLILAITIMAKNPKDYGLADVDLDQPLEYDTLEVKTPINLALIADAVDRPLTELRDLNPGLLKPVAPAGYTLHVPKGTSNAVLASLENIPPERRMTWRMHRVERGETLSQIAKEFKTPASSIAQVNNSFAEAPEAGDLLIIPASYNPDAPASRRQIRTGYTARRGKTSKATLRQSASRTVPEHVLHHRASTRTMRTASLRTAPATD